MKTLVPTEEYEQTLLVNWLTENSYTFSSIPNSTFTRSWAVKARNTRTGLRAGMPDLAIVLKCRRLLFIELKRAKGGRLSPEQKLWIEALNGCEGVSAAVCAGFEAARDFVLAQEQLLVQD